MLLCKLKINYFGRFHNREIELKPGINLIYGDNEAGKSTIHTFIRGMLFGIERLRGRGASSKEDVYQRYLPWDYPGAYGGSMDIQIEDKKYRLQRSFHANDKSFTILDLSTGREVKLREGLISELLPGLTEATFKNTISIEQRKPQTDTELAKQVRNYIANLSIAKSKEIDVAKALGFLMEQKKQLETSLHSTALQELQAEIEEGEIKEEKLDQLTIQLHQLLQEEQIYQRQKEAMTTYEDSDLIKKMEQLPAILEKYRSYQELARQITVLEANAEKLLARISQGKNEQLGMEELKEDVIKAQYIQTELLTMGNNRLKLQNEQAVIKKINNKNIYISVVPAAVLAVLMIIIAGLHPSVITLSALLLGLGVGAYSILNHKHQKKLQFLTDDVNDLMQTISSAQIECENLLQKHKVHSVQEITEKLEEIRKNYYASLHVIEQLKELETRRNDIEDNRDLVYEIIMKYMQCFIKAEDLSPDTMQHLDQEIQHRKQEAAGKQAEVICQYDACKLRIEKLRWEISALEGNEEQLLKNKEQYKVAEQKQKENTCELEAVKLALSTIKELAAKIHDGFGQELNHTVSEVIAEVTQDKYNDLKVDEKLDVKVAWNGNYVLLDRLSSGTMDQVYFALRLAVADLLLGRDEVPLLLDDSFALYDETRVKATLTRIAGQKQVILFTCHRREQSLLEELGIPYHYIDLGDE